MSSKLQYCTTDPEIPIPASGSAQTSSGSGNKTFKVQIPKSVVEVTSQPDLVTNDPIAGNIVKVTEKPCPVGCDAGPIEILGIS
jgi:hypothetical protein